MKMHLVEKNDIKNPVNSEQLDSGMDLWHYERLSRRTSPSAAGGSTAPHFKEEKEDLWVTQEEEFVPGQEEADLSKFPLTVVSVKTEEHEDKPPESSQLHHSPNVCEKQLLPEKQECSYRMVKEDPSKKTRCHGPFGVSFFSLTQTLPCKK
ncbi:uncharacterized protein LOC133545354 isoform X4 [Nerophis ophidion]|uniref:uncharacterized protein LOC133545354 isoform X4 n=1 Tax=Nerophis ophidion TaxID=159077 RepID=UPI002AE081B9|nr:uncharacterized protein LOC133545354 isoform X4 [Nerophis ophidion]